MEVHHQDGNRNNNRYANLLLLHGHSHDRLHGQPRRELRGYGGSPLPDRGVNPLLRNLAGTDHALNGLPDSIGLNLLVVHRQMLLKLRPDMFFLR